VDLHLELDEQSRREVPAGLVALIRATLAAAGVVDDAHDSEVAAYIELQLQRADPRDLDVAIGQVVLERYRALRAETVAEPAVQSDGQLLGDATDGPLLDGSKDLPPGAFTESPSKVFDPLEAVIEQPAEAVIEQLPREFEPSDTVTEESPDVIVPPEGDEVALPDDVVPTEDALTEQPLDEIAPPEEMVTFPDVVAPSEDDEPSPAEAVVEQVSQEFQPSETITKESPEDALTEEPLDVIAPAEYDELAPPVEVAPLDVVAPIGLDPV